MQQKPQHTPGPYEAEATANNGARGAWIRGSNKNWIALSCGNTDEEAMANKEFLVNALNAHNPQHRVIEAADCEPGKHQDWALTIQWPDGEETVELVSHRAAALLGYTPDGE